VAPGTQHPRRGTRGTLGTCGTPFVNYDPVKIIDLTT